MKVKELISMLEKFDENTEVAIGCGLDDEYAAEIGGVCSVEGGEMTYTGENENGKIVKYALIYSPTNGGYTEITW